MTFEIYNKRFTTDLVNKEKNKIFIFGDNDIRSGKGGQAVIRDCENSIGIRTKKYPSNKESSFYNDREFYQNKEKIDYDILKIKRKSLNNKMVFSNNGYGTGLSSLKEKAPKTFKYLCLLLKYHFNFDNEKGKKWYKIPGHDDIKSAKYVNIKNGEVLCPDSNDLFRNYILEKSIYTNYDMILNGIKSSFTSKKFYKIGETIVLSFPNESNYIVVNCCGSYKLSKDNWIFEGYKNIMLDKINTTDYYQTHFDHVCILTQSGKIFFRKDIF